MFLERLIQNNYPLYEYAYKAHQSGEILPDTYLLDLDTIVSNGKKMVKEASRYNLELYFMLKQIGRNPMVAKELIKIGFKGCVAVDYKEALLMLDNDIPLCNVGHLEQVPYSVLKRIVGSKPKLITVFSKEKIKEINEVSKQLNVISNIMLRITDEDATIYSGQEAGIPSNEINDYIDLIESLGNVELKGITVFPALLFDGEKISETENINALKRAQKIMSERGYKDINYNIPSASCCASFKLISELGGKSAEPGHGLTGTTPLHKESDEAEKVGYVYVSEISHNFRGKALCFGGGNYRRGHLENCMVGKDVKSAVKYKVHAPDDDSIDYHFIIDSECNVSDTVVMCFRTQMFTTRSHVGVVKGLSENKPELFLFDSLGKEIKRNW
ncbi:MAG: alanine racemase [Erysipelotrichaceae bacterium]